MFWPIIIFLGLIDAGAWGFIGYITYTGHQAMNPPTQSQPVHNDRLQ